MFILHTFKVVSTHFLPDSSHCISSYLVVIPWLLIFQVFAVQISENLSASLHLKFNGTVLTHRCTTAWSFACRARLGIHIGHPNFCGCCNSTIAGLIDSISSSMELSWPVVVQQHCHWLVWPIWVCGAVLASRYGPN